VLPLRLRWSLAIGAPIVADAGLDPTALGGWAPDHVARARGEHELRMAASEALAEAYGITSRDTLMAWARPRLQGRRELAHVVAAFSIATVAQHVSEDDAWQAIALAARLAQLTYRSWDELAATCEPVADDVRAQWATLPWDTELEVTLAEAPTRRFLRATCPACGARATRRSPTAYVYCDRCGNLAGYDFERACEQPLERPGPAYEAIRAELAGRLAEARGDLLRTRAVQRALFDAWIDACPGAVPVRIQDPAYRAAYVAMLAEGETRAAFDAEACELRTALDAAVAQLGFTTAGGETRVLDAPYRAMEAAMFAHEARRHALALAHGIYEMHPDRASPALIRRIGFSIYAQGWLPYLAEADAQALLARTDLAAAYEVAEPPATRAVRCPRCEEVLDVVVEARRVVCAHCGRPVDVTGP
jgi:ribosomal protein S27E